MKATREYECPTCNYHTEAYLTHLDTLTCPLCGTTMQRLFSCPSIHVHSQETHRAEKEKGLIEGVYEKQGLYAKVKDPTHSDYDCFRQGM